MTYVERVTSGLVFKKINSRLVRVIILRKEDGVKNDGTLYTNKSRKRRVLPCVPREIGAIKKIQIANAIERH